jgi:tRNA threonylcarbamoyladenosine biosynthesis protein TsaE
MSGNGRTLVVRSGSVEETRSIGAAFARSLVPGVTLSLEGPLGAGKTEFVRGFCDGLGVVSVVTSPSYTLWNEYETADGHRVMHLDCFRLAGARELEELGLEDRRDPGGFVLVEWGDRALAALPPRTIRIRLEPDPNAEDGRRLSVRLPEGVDFQAGIPASAESEELP